MNELLANWRMLLALACVGVLVIGPFFTLWGLWRRDQTVVAEAAKWGQALSGPRTAQQQQQAEFDELHRLVSSLSAPEPPPADSDSNSNP